MSTRHQATQLSPLTYAPPPEVVAQISRTRDYNATPDIFSNPHPSIASSAPSENTPNIPGENGRRIERLPSFEALRSCSTRTGDLHPGFVDHIYGRPRSAPSSVSSQATEKRAIDKTGIRMDRLRRSAMSEQAWANEALKLRCAPSCGQELERRHEVPQEIDGSLYHTGGKRPKVAFQTLPGCRESNISDSLPVAQLMAVMRGSARKVERTCSNCKVSQTRQWVRGGGPMWLCHSCGQFWRKNGCDRPKSLWNRPTFKRSLRKQRTLEGEKVREGRSESFRTDRECPSAGFLSGKKLVECGQSLTNHPLLPGNTRSLRQIHTIPDLLASSRHSLQRGPRMHGSGNAEEVAKADFVIPRLPPMSQLLNHPSIHTDRPTNN